MHDFRLTALVTLATVFLHFMIAWGVGRARGKYGIKAPAVSGNVDFERVYRVQMNTLETTMMFLPALWLYAAFVSGQWAAALGAVWVAARVWYALAYAQDAARRGPAFGLSMLVVGVLSVGAAWGVIKALI
jgi:glutathione S-transferase